MPKNATYNNKPVYRIAVDDSVEGMTKVSLVDYPAVEKDFIALAAQKIPQTYAVQDEEKRLVRGVLLRADFPIYRKDEKMGEYYIVFEKDTIRQLAEQYLTDGHANDVNQMHEKGTDVTGVNLVQWFIKDTAAGVDPAGFEDIEDGSLFAEYHVENDDVWQGIKDGTFKGFSIECVTYYDPVKEGEATFEEDALLAFINKYKNMPNLFAKLRAAFNEIVEQHFKTDTTDKGVIAWDGEDAIKVGDKVEIVAENDDRSTAPDGDYTLSDGTVITVESGAVTAVKEPEEDPNAGAGEGSEGTEGTEGAAEGTEGTAKTEARDQNPRAGFLSKVKSLFESESYDEKRAKIAAAIAAAGYTDGYIYEAGDDYAIYVYWNEETNWEDRYLKFTVTWNEAGDAEVSDPVKVKHAFVPEDGAPAAENKPENEAEAEDLRAEVNDMKKAVNGLIDIVTKQKERIDALAGQPAGKPAAEAFRAAKENAGKTGDEDPVKKGLKKIFNS